MELKPYWIWRATTTLKDVRTYSPHYFLFPKASECYLLQRVRLTRKLNGTEG